MINIITYLKAIHAKYYNKDKKEFYCLSIISAGMLMIIIGYIIFKPNEVAPVDPFSSPVVLSCFHDSTVKYIKENTLKDWKSVVVDRNNTKFVLNKQSYNMYLSDYNYCITRVNF